MLILKQEQMRAYTHVCKQVKPSARDYRKEYTLLLIAVYAGLPRPTYEMFQGTDVYGSLKTKYNTADVPKEIKGRERKNYSRFLSALRVYDSLHAYFFDIFLKATRKPFYHKVTEQASEEDLVRYISNLEDFDKYKVKRYTRFSADFSDASPIVSIIANGIPCPPEPDDRDKETFVRIVASLREML